MRFFQTHAEENIMNQPNIEEKLWNSLAKKRKKSKEKIESFLCCPFLSFYDSLLSGIDFTNLKPYSLSKWFQLSRKAVNKSSLVGLSLSLSLSFSLVLLSLNFSPFLSLLFNVYFLLTHSLFTFFLCFLSYFLLCLID